MCVRHSEASSLGEDCEEKNLGMGYANEGAVVVLRLRAAGLRGMPMGSCDVSSMLMRLLRWCQYANEGAAVVPVC